MNPQVETIIENNDTLTFTLSGVNVSLANAIRRTILSDIPIVVFRTSPIESNKAKITANTSRLNNEILKQRLSCIPIHISDLQMPLQNYIAELNKENLTDTLMYVTTEDFRIKNVQTGEYLSEKNTREIFPPCEQTGYYIDIARLRPKISDEIPGEKLQLTCEFSIGNAKLDSMFNVASTCSYGYTVDAEGKKLSKSKGNYVALDQLIHQHGADILRLWVASVDYQSDVRISEEIIKQVAEVYRKLRNTFRFILGNLNDYDQQTFAIETLPEVDQFILGNKKASKCLLAFLSTAIPELIWNIRFTNDWTPDVDFFIEVIFEAIGGHFIH